MCTKIKKWLWVENKNKKLEKKWKINWMRVESYLSVIKKAKVNRQLSVKSVCVCDVVLWLQSKCEGKVSERKRSGHTQKKFLFLFHLWCCCCWLSRWLSAWRPQHYGEELPTGCQRCRRPGVGGPSWECCSWLMQVGKRFGTFANGTNLTKYW